MLLNGLSYNRAEFFSYRGDFDYELEVPYLEPEPEAGQVSVADSSDYSYLEGDFNKFAFNDLLIVLAPFRFFSHVHLLRILYERLEISVNDGNIIIVAHGAKKEALLSTIREIIQKAGDKQIFEKKILEQYFDLFCISSESDNTQG